MSCINPDGYIPTERINMVKSVYDVVCFSLIFSIFKNKYFFFGFPFIAVCRNPDFS